MWERLIASNLADRDEARRARLLNVLTLSLLLGMALFSLSGLVIWMWGGDVDVVLFAGVPGAISAILVLTYVLVRLGRLRIAVWAFLGLLNVMLLVLLLALGHRSAMPIFIPTAILAVAVLARQRIAFAVAVCWMVAYLVVAIAETSGWHDPFLIPYDQAFPPQLLIIGRVLGIGLMGVLAWLSAGSMLDAIADARRNLARAQLHEAELERARQSLSQQVRERTRDLEDALTDVQESMFEQTALLDALRAQSIPVVPLFRQVIALPVVGMLDAERTERLLSSMLSGIEQYDARIVLLDITGVPVIDEGAAQGLAEAVGGARLLGAECVLVGVGPEIASKLVDLGSDLGWLTSRGDMEAGLRYALRRLHRSLNVPTLP
jgi:anti-anti-sigma regulatory factor